MPVMPAFAVVNGGIGKGGTCLLLYGRIREQSRSLLKWKEPKLDVGLDLDFNSATHCLAA